MSQNDSETPNIQTPETDLEPADTIALTEADHLDHDVAVMLGMIVGDAWWTR